MKSVLGESAAEAKQQIPRAAALRNDNAGVGGMLIATGFAAVMG
jgi:hypothetical protein